MFKDLVSIIVPTHNRAGYLTKALASIANQSYSNVEIIVIANGCNDNTDETINQFRQQYNQTIIYLVFDQILGGAKARNIGLDYAQGEYIAFLDDDDSWHRDKLQSQLTLLKQDKYAIISSNFVYVYAQNEQHKYPRAIRSPIINIEDLYYENSLMGFSFCLIKQASLANHRINEHLDALQDWDLWLKILQSTGLSAYINPAHHVYYRIDGSRISNTYPQLIKAQRIFLTSWQDLLDNASIRYHKMRTVCLELKIQKKSRCQYYWHYFMAFFMIIRVIFNSPYRYKMQKYIHYLLLPIINIYTARIKLWSQFKLKHENFNQLQR